MKCGAFLPAGLVCVLLGCIGPNHQPEARLVTGSAAPVVQRSYALGVQRTVAAGEVLAQVKYVLKEKKYPNFLRLRQAVTIRTGNRILNLPDGRLLTFIGPARVDGADYMAYGDIHSDDGLGEFYYLTPDMVLAPVVYIKDRKIFPTGLEPVLSTWPEQVRLAAPAEVRWVPGDRPDHEILFDGLDAGGIHLIYRERAPDGSIAPSSVQRLSFPAYSVFLQCLDTRIRVYECTENRLVATVIED